MKKRGRRPKPHIDRDNQHINGLYRRPDGRWRICATGQTFVEPDEQRAIARFRQWQRRQKPGLMRLPLSLMSADADAGIEATLDAGGIIEVVKEKPGGLSFENVPEELLWAWLREQLLKRPEYVAERVGIPEVARLADLPPRRPSPKLADLFGDYLRHAKMSPHERRRSQTILEDFATHTQATSLQGLTRTAALRWTDAIRDREYTPATIAKWYQKPKAALHHALRRDYDPQQVRAALDACAVLRPPAGAKTYDPHPIAPADFARLMKGADGWEQALLLVMLNCCLYGGEAMDLRWDDLDLDKRVYVADRGKTGITRVAVLWPRTVKALQTLPQQGAHVFVSSHGIPYHPNSLRKRFVALRTRAGVAGSVMLSDIRDGAYTAAVEAGVELNLCRALAGHRSGMADHYVKRRPRLVTPACAAVHGAYFGDTGEEL